MNTITHNGKDYTVEIVADEDQGTPWENEDGHGSVSDWRRDGYRGPNKSPGERELCRDGRSARFYDFAEAVKIAKRDRWGYGGMRDGETIGQRAAAAAEADFQRLRAWCDGQWGYVGVIVRPAGACKCCGPSESLWGIESDAYEYLEEVARELAEQLAG